MFLKLASVLKIFFFDFIYLLLERGKGKEKEKERNINVWGVHGLVVSHTPPTGDLAHNPGICPDWEWNQLHFGLQADTQSTEPHHFLER